MLDFDEILVSVKNPQIRKYLQEAIKSYQIGNYRSAILAVWVATMFDLVKKFEILVEQCEPTAIEKWNQLEPKIKNHKNWEQELIQAAKAAAMISRYEADILESLSKTRNRYAHPSFDEVGTLFDPTPEEVRYFIRTLYDIALSQPAQLGAFYVKQLLESIKNPTFFPSQPSSDELTELKEHVIEKIRRINDRQIPRLIKELFKDLASPTSEEHKINVLCFLVNAWGAKAELRISAEISIHWDEYILGQNISFTILEGILNYPECINELSDKSKMAIASAFRSQILRRQRYSESAIKFLTSADSVPIAQSLLDEASILIPLKKVIREGNHYAYLFGDKFAEIFGQDILKETRQVLKTRDGYQVNPVLSVLRLCGIWNLADTLSELEQIGFANELVLSLNSNNWETMHLLNFNNRGEIPIKWIRLLLDQWSDFLMEWPGLKMCYLEHYLGLLKRHKDELGDYEKSKEVIQGIIQSTDGRIAESVAELETNELAWEFWQEVVVRYGNV
ncbi:MAG: hypothetical protein RLZZ511_4205 [Cyanobacteriota bacterium]|jgi:hypothetical protein